MMKAKSLINYLRYLEYRTSQCLSNIVMFVCSDLVKVIRHLPQADYKPLGSRIILLIFALLLLLFTPFTQITILSSHIKYSYPKYSWEATKPSLWRVMIGDMRSFGWDRNTVVIYDQLILGTYNITSEQILPCRFLHMAVFEWKDPSLPRGISFFSNSWRK